MFKDCISLQEIEVGFDEWDVNCTQNWMENVSKTGKFIKHMYLSDDERYLNNSNFVPEGWTVITQ
jgi:hypothetical protein